MPAIAQAMEPLVAFVKEQRAPVVPVVLEDGDGYTRQELEFLASSLEAIASDSNGDEAFLVEAYGGRRRCNICGIETRTPLCMHQHVASRQHCLSVSRSSLLDGAAKSGASNQAQKKPLRSKEALQSLLTEGLRAQIPEPPDVALWHLYTAAKANP